MLPEKICDSKLCLEALIGIRAECDSEECADFYIEDIEGLDIDKLAQLASPQSPSGVSVAHDLIRQASLEMLGDIELLIGNGYSLQDTFGDVCSQCEFVTIYQAGGGVRVLNAVSSQYSILNIHTMDILTNFTGEAVLNVDNGKTIEQFMVTLQAGIIAPVVLNYSTTEHAVNVYFADNTIQAGTIRCLTSSGCGCGGTRNRNALDTVRFSGIVNSVAATSQYGFKICASISCSSDMLVCDLVTKTPRIFALTLLYKVAQKAYSTSVLQTSRITPFTSGNGEEKRMDMRDYFEGLYKQRLNGKGATKGIGSIINTYLRQRTDRCVSCESAVSKVGWAIG